MRILTWNINGIRTVPQYHPWNTLKTHDAILNHLQADIINFQEVKSSRSALPAPVALPPSFDAYYSFPLSKNGYSGVATYTASGITALKAEEGLTGQLRQPHLKPPPSVEERIFSLDSYDELDMPSADLKSLDAEGRVLAFDFGLFVLINVYCPNDGSTEEDTTRFDYKMAFHRLLEARVRALIREGREVILLGDINACAALIDHCEGDIIKRRGVAQGFDGDAEEYFWAENEARRWLRDLLEGYKKCLVDVVRRYHPEREGMFTCWNTKLSARASNYGTRIDYILVTPGLLSWIKGADIEPAIIGSDHCPVWIDLYEEIEVHSHEGITTTKKLRDAMYCNATGESKAKERDSPRLATRFWDEYSGKQRLLASFFTAGPKKGKSKAKEPVEAITNVTPPQAESKPCQTLIKTLNESESSILSVDDSPFQPLLPTSESPPSLESSPTAPSSSNESKKRKTPPPTSSPALASFSQPTSKKQKKEKEQKKTGQAKLSSFFVAPSTGKGKGKGRAASTSKSRKSASTDGTKTETPAVVDLTAIDGEGDEVATDVDTAGKADDDGLWQANLSQSSSSLSNASSSQAWKSLLTRPDPPRCLVHNEVAKELKVNKPGANKGRAFWVCSRPVGPGYDKGPSERPREEVDPRWKCNFFVWSSDLAAKRGSAAGK
ncbi:DNase I-like protein [Gymnopus androsaceus JB14]|uniref:DNA-(apurinic or apyrimidinic site) endonuclease n=1 Tax=Gymnopus androsaceus JB14 TaxID=1447944 RepID=A0A6A4IIZ1_9AGAR|nr:DNase I-like protein [Gymnopus androsaceus JB14]